MIQRKQTLFLAIAALLSAATWLFPVSNFQRGEESYVFVTTGFIGPDGVLIDDPTPIVPMHILYSALALVLTVIIFMYGNRQRQMRVLSGTYILIVAVLAGTFIIDNSFLAYLRGPTAVVHSLGVSYFLPIGVLLLAILAHRAIKADESLVKSMDRLR